MRILFIHNRYRQEGGEDVAFELEADLLRRNHTVEILLFDNSRIAKFFDNLHAGLFSIYNFSSAKKIKKVISVFKPDIIHVHNLFFTASPSILIAARKARIPVIVTLHNYRLICSNALLLRDNKTCELCINKKLPIEGIKYKCYHNSRVQSALVTSITGFHKLLKTWNHCVSKYICLTEFSRQKILNSSVQLKADQLSVISNCVPDVKYDFLPRGNYFLYVGRISEEKGISTLIKGFKQMESETLLIVGDGPEKVKLQEQYSSASNIIFAGKKNKAEVLNLMSKSKALLFPSLCYENLPFTIIESFSTATPVIASRLGAMLELIKDEVNGFHFTSGDPQDLTKVIQKFVQLDEEKQKKLYAHARLSYEEKFHPDAHYKALMSVYEKAIEENKK